MCVMRGGPWVVSCLRPKGHFICRQIHVPYLKKVSLLIRPLIFTMNGIFSCAALDTLEMLASTGLVAGVAPYKIAEFFIVPEIQQVPVVFPCFEIVEPV